MKKETMNVHQALCEIKLLDKRLMSEITNLKSVGITKKVAQMVGAQSVTKFKEEAISQYQKINDLIARRAAIKSAVVLSNAVTKVRIGGKEYTIAEAIELKNHGMDGKRKLLEMLTYQLQVGENTITRTNELNDSKCDNYIKETFSNKENKSGAAEIQAARDGYLTSLAVELIDPLNVREEIRKLSDEIDKFTAEADSVLSTSNATTELTIEY